MKKNSNKHVNAVKELINIMDKHDCSLVETYVCDDTPIVIEGDDCEDTYALDSIRVDENKLIIFCCSSSYDNEEVTSKEISTDILIEILEWVKDNEDELFEDWE